MFIGTCTCLPKKIFLLQRAHSGVKPPPKPKPPASRPAPPKAHKPIASTTEKQEDEPASVCLLIC